MRSSNTHKKNPDRFHGRVEDIQQSCAVDGCNENGEFRAPSIYGPGESFDGPGQWRWLCLDHVREFNAAYDFFEGMDDEAVRAAQHPVNGWDSRRRIYHSNGSTPPAWADFIDPLDAIGARFSESISKPSRHGLPISKQDQKALKTLGLGEDAGSSDIRRRYSELVRQYHPDRNGGDRSFEKQLANVISAYTQLKQSPDFK